MCIRYEIRELETDRVIDPSMVADALLVIDEQTMTIMHGQPLIIYYVCVARLTEKPPIVISTPLGSRVA